MAAIRIYSESEIDFPVDSPSIDKAVQLLSQAHVFDVETTSQVRHPQDMSRSLGPQPP